MGEGSIFVALSPSTEAIYEDVGGSWRHAEKILEGGGVLSKLILHCVVCVRCSRDRKLGGKKTEKN